MSLFKIDKIEKFFLIISINFILGIFIFNYYVNYFRHYSTSYLSNENQYNQYPSPKESNFIKLQLIAEKKYPDLEVLINGEVFTTFGEEKVILIPVKRGNVIHINGTMYEEDLKVGIIDTTVNFIGKDIEKEIIIKDGIEFLTLIQFYLV